MEYTESLFPELRQLLFLYTEDEPIFKSFGIEREVERPPQQGMAEIGGLPGHRADRGAGLGGRQHGQVRGQARLRGDDPEDQREAAVRSPGRCASAIWGASSSSTFIDMARQENRDKVMAISRSAQGRPVSHERVLLSELGLVEMTESASVRG